MVRFKGAAKRALVQQASVEDGDGGETLELQEARVKQIYTEGLRLNTEGKVSEAVQALLRALDDPAFSRDVVGNPRFATLRRVQYLCIKNLADFMEKLDDKAMAVEWLAQAVDLDGRDVVVWHKLGSLAMQLDRLNVARTAFQQGLALRPDHLLCLSKLCEVTYAVGDLQACAAASKRLLAIQPDHARAMALQGLSMLQTPATRAEGEDLLADARHMSRGWDDEEVARLKEAREKRPRSEAPAPPLVEPLAIEQLTWRCLVDSVVQAATTHGAKGPCGFSTLLTLSFPDASAMEVEELSPETDALVEATGEARFRIELALCNKCGGDDEEQDDVLLCANYEKCGSCVHLTCMHPPKKEAPKDDWVCPKCCPPKADDGDEATQPLDGMEEEQDGASRDSMVGSKRALVGGAADAGARKRPSARRPSESRAEPDTSRRSTRLSVVPAALDEGRSTAHDHLARLLKLVAPAGGEEGTDQAAREDADQVAQGDPAGGGAEEEEKDTISRYAMLALVQDGTVAEGEEVAALLGGCPSPVGLLDLVHRVMHAMATVATQQRIRGKVVDSLLELDLIAHGHLTYSAEAALCLAELHDDVRAQLLAVKAAREEEERADGKEALGEEAGALVPAGEGAGAGAAGGGGDKAPENVGEAVMSGEAGAQEAAAEEGVRLERHRVQLAAHMRVLWSERLGSAEARARYFWLLARDSVAHSRPLVARDCFAECLAATEEVLPAHRVLRPSCTHANFLTPKSIASCRQGPLAQLESEALDAQLGTLTARLRGGEAAGRAECAAQVVKLLAHDVVPEAAQSGWEVRTLTPPLARARERWSKAENTRDEREKRIERLLLLLEASALQEEADRDVRLDLYSLNVLLAELIGLDSCHDSKAKDSRGKDLGWFRGLDKVGVARGTDVLGAVMSWQKSNVFLAARARASPDGDEEDAGLAATLAAQGQHLELQLARLVVRLGCTKAGTGDSGSLFGSMAVLLYSLQPILHPDQPFFPKRAEILSIVMEELLRRNESDDAGFFRFYMSILVEERRGARRDKAVAEAKEKAEAEAVEAKEKEAEEEGEEEEAGESEEDLGEESESEEEEEGDEEERLGRELAKCYYITLGLKFRKYRECTRWVDKLLALDDSGRKVSSAGARRLPLDTELSLGLWDFCQDMVATFHTKARASVRGDLKEALEQIWQQVYPEAPPDVASAKALVTDHLASGFDLFRRIRTAQDIPPDWEHQFLDVRFSQLIAPAKASNQSSARRALLPTDSQECIIVDSPSGGEAGGMAGDSQSSDVMIIEDDPSVEAAAPTVAPGASATSAAPEGSGGGASGDQDMEGGAAHAGGGKEEGDGGDARASGAKDEAPAASVGGADAVVVKLERGEEAVGEEGGAAQRDAPPSKESEVAERERAMLRSFYWVLAQCSLGGDEKRAIELYLADLSMTPSRVESWLGLAQAYERRLLHNSDLPNPSGIRMFCSLEHSAEAQKLLCHAMRSFLAALDLAPTNTPARVGLATMLILAAQASKTRPAMRFGICSRAHRLLSEVQDRAPSSPRGDVPAIDWKVAFLMGKLSHKVGNLPRALSELSAAMLANREAENLGIEPFYKLHALRAKHVLDASDEELAAMAEFSVAACLALARDAAAKEAEHPGGAGKRAAPVTADMSDALVASAEEEQREFEAGVGGLGLDLNLAGAGLREAELRDAMTALRLVLLHTSALKNKWQHSRSRYQLARLISRLPAPHLSERLSHLSAAVVEVLAPLFFNARDEALTPPWFQFIQFGEKQAQQVPVHNAGTLVRLKNKASMLLATHLRARHPHTDAADRLEKLLDFLFRDERARQRDRDFSRDFKESQSVSRAVKHAVVQLFAVLTAMADAAGSQRSLELAEAAFAKTGRLRQLFTDQDWLFKGVMLSVTEQVTSGNVGLADRTLDRPMTLASQECPVLSLLGRTCAIYTHERGMLYRETYREPGPKCMNSAMQIWLSNFGPERKQSKLTLTPSRSVNASSAAPVLSPADLAPSHLSASSSLLASRPSGGEPRPGGDAKPAASPARAAPASPASRGGGAFASPGARSGGASGLRLDGAIVIDDAPAAAPAPASASKSLAEEYDVVAID